MQARCPLLQNVCNATFRCRLFKMSELHQADPGLRTRAASLFRNIDVFPKVADEARARSASGGVTTLVVALCILVLAVTEARLYTSIRTDETLEVDVSRGGKVAVDFNITFHHLPCSLMSVDSMDISGQMCFKPSHFRIGFGYSQLDLD